MRSELPDEFPGKEARKELPDLRELRGAGKSMKRWEDREEEGEENPSEDPPS